MKPITEVVLYLSQSRLTALMVTRISQLFGQFCLSQRLSGKLCTGKTKPVLKCISSKDIKKVFDL